MKLTKAIEKAKAKKSPLDAATTAPKGETAFRAPDHGPVEEMHEAAPEFLKKTPAPDHGPAEEAREATIPEPSTKPSGSKWKSAPVYTHSTNITLNRKRVIANRCIALDSDSAEIQSYKILRTQILLATREKGWNTVMVTSARPGDGKTLTTINLALTFAMEYDQTVLLVDGDLKRQMIHKYLGFKSEKGLVDCLVNERPLSEIIVWPGIPKLSIISGGRTIQDSTELLGSPNMRSLVRDVKSRYDDRYVIFDVPPMLGGADAIAFAPLVDCIVMVVQPRTSTREVTRCMEQIPKEKFLGFVLNRQGKPIEPYGDVRK
ncbi:MAG: AAA family ATPase [Desulfobacterales bacterium]|nr:AAA family ATPase [Desulfobacterales bacterium]